MESRSCCSSLIHCIAVPGKLLAVNDGDLGGDGTPDWADSFNADGIPWSSDQPHPGYPHDDYSPDTTFTPIKVTLPAWYHGTVRFPPAPPAPDSPGEHPPPS